MKSGVFYLLSSNIHNNDQLNLIEKFVCVITKKKWRSGKSICIACENKLQAIRIDEMLWNFDQNSFLPHSLFKSGIEHVPIIILWKQCYYNNNTKNLLINLIQKEMNFFYNFDEIIDFVPNEDILKKWARVRYKSYKTVGFELRTFKISDFH